MNNDTDSMLRREKDILDRLDNVRRLIEMETTLICGCGFRGWSRYRETDKNGEWISQRTLLEELRDEIQLQLLSITALCYGDNPDVGEPIPMLEFENGKMDKFRETWEECLRWNA